MAERKVKFVEGEIYHVYNRGNFRHEIFHDKQDYDRFKKIMYIANGEKRFKFKDILKYENNLYNFKKGDEEVCIFAYVLMPNHFHLLVQIKNRAIDTGDRKSLVNKNLNNGLSNFMKRLTSAYSMYYNRKYRKTGGLFEGKFKAEHVLRFEYFKYLFSYIHLNPIKLFQSDWKEIGILDAKRTNEFINNFEHSSFREYFSEDKRVEAAIINKQEFFKKLPKDVDLEREMFEWLNYINQV